MWYLVVKYIKTQSEIMTDEELKSLVESNAKAIQALIEERQKSEKLLYQAMTICNNAQATIAKCYVDQIDVNDNTNSHEVNYD